MSTMDTITLVTGGNKGIGFETARRLAAIGHSVIIGARDRDRGESAAAELGVQFVQMDVTDTGSVARAAAEVDAMHGRVDVVVNNAAVNIAPGALSEATADAALETLDVNVVGPIRVIATFLPLLRRSEHPRIVNVSSRVGSFAATIEHDMFDTTVVPPVYAVSKTALDMVTLKCSRELPGILVNAADPGYTATDLNGGQGTQSVAEGSDAIVRLATLPPGGPTGTLQDRHGPVPW